MSIDIYILAAHLWLGTPAPSLIPSDKTKILIVYYLGLHAMLAEYFGSFTPPPFNLLNRLLGSLHRRSEEKNKTE